MGQETAPENPLPEQPSKAAAETARVEKHKQAYIKELRQHPGGRRLTESSSWSKVNDATYVVLKYWKEKLGREIDFSELPTLREEYLQQ